MTDTISIKEYAEIKGVSVQSVYKRLDSTLKPYVVQRLNDRGKPQKRLKIEVLDDKAFNPYSTPIQPDSTPDSTPIQPGVEQPLNNPEKPPEMAPGDDLTAHLQEEVKFLRDQIERLTDSLQFEQRKNAELSAQLHLLQSPVEDQQEPEKNKGFIARLKSWWNSTAPQQ